MGDEQKRQREELYARARANFPFERVQVQGADAFPAWQRLRADHRGTPVIIGDDESLLNLVAPFDNSGSSPVRPVADILEAAALIRIPENLFERRKAELAATREAIAQLLAGPDANLPRIIENRDFESAVQELLPRASQDPTPRSQESRLLSPDETRARLSQDLGEPQDGEWPADPPPSTGLTVATDILTGKPLANVHIALVPTDDWTTVPAYLRWGGWNDCPPPEVHVAALRAWHARYDLQLVGLNLDTMNLRAAKRPTTREEALALAHEQYAYCTDIVEQGTGTYSVLAAALMSDDWWFFWWD